MNKELKSTYMVFPNDLNSKGNLFGGKVMSLMDIECAKLGRLMVNDVYNVVTKGVSNIDFIHPAKQGDIIEIHASLLDVGNTSIKIKVEVNCLRGDNINDKICEATFTMVTTLNDKKINHNLKLLQHE